MRKTLNATWRPVAAKSAWVHVYRVPLYYQGDVRGDVPVTGCAGAFQVPGYRCIAAAIARSNLCLAMIRPKPVSYTHLTLPTICSV
eukprot:1985660-Rhodomonas_salina.1